MEAAEARAVSHFVLEKSKWWAGRGRGRKGVWRQGLCRGHSILGDAGMKGWALAASLDPWYSLADPPLSWVSGDLGSGNSFFFPLCPRGVLFARGSERKAGFLPASSCQQGPMEP